MDAPRPHQNIRGYDYGTDRAAKSPFAVAEWEQLTEESAPAIVPRFFATFSRAEPCQGRARFLSKRAEGPNPSHLGSESR
jgi:hypothetical protein